MVVGREAKFAAQQIAASHANNQFMIFHISHSTSVVFHEMCVWGMRENFFFLYGTMKNDISEWNYLQILIVKSFLLLLLSIGGIKRSWLTIGSVHICQEVE